MREQFHGVGRRARGLSLAALCLVVALWCGPALAQEPPPEETPAAVQESVAQSEPETPAETTAPARTPVEESSNERKPKPGMMEQLEIYGDTIPTIPRRFERRARELPEEIPDRLRNFPSRVKKLPRDIEEGMGDFIQEVPFPGAPPVKDRPPGWNREFFLDLPKEPMDEAEGFGLVPQLGYSQETDFLYGLGFAVGSWPFKKDHLEIGAAGTTKNQYELEFDYIAPQQAGGLFRMELESNLRTWVSSYFGQGIDTNESDRDQFDYDSFNVDFSWWVHLPMHFRAGVVFGLEEWDIVRTTFDPNGIFITATPIGSNGGRVVTIGGGLAFDNRDNEFFPNDGVLVEGRVVNSNDAYGGDFDYSRMTIDFRAFWTPVKTGHVIALRTFYDVTFQGNPPFFVEPVLGGAEFARGYFEGRFRDSNALAATLEYRFPIYGRINAALFFDIGQVQGSPLDFTLSDFKPTGGGSLGYLIPPGKILLVRLEMAASEDQVTFALRFGHSF
ncbi:MAG: BamA/TamA family outer membrane protein [Chrysiogenetes bacterium]|nr:BamA/TamA family outer membrane protein [Chrysiogenetes bacterium]